MPTKVLIGNIQFVTARNGKSVKVNKGQSFDFTDAELADLDKFSEQHGTPMYRDPVNESAAAPAPAGKDDQHSKTVAVVSALLADDTNLNGDGKLKMDVLTDALKTAGLPKISAADRDAIVAELADL